MNNINGLSAKEFMEEFASRSKKIFNPAIPQEGSSLYGIKVVTDISDDVEDILTFIINGLSVGNSYKEILSTVGFVNLTDENKFCAANLATSRIIKAGADSESNKLILYFIHDNVYESAELNKVGVEIFVQQDNKNHAVEVSYLTEEEYESIESELEVITKGEIDSHFSFSINTGENIIHITNGSDIVEPIDYIANAKNADSLNNDISISVNSGVFNPQITGSGSIDGGDLIGNLNLSVNTQPIVQDVLNNLLIPVASSTTLGGINIAGNSYTFTDPEYPVKLKSVNNKNYAYIDLTNFAELQQQDIHRYTNMNDATADHPNLGEIVLYIGNTTPNYTRGYFYMRVRELIKGELASGTNWQLTNPASGLDILNNAITEYNKQNDHLLTTSQVLTLTPNVDTISANLINDDTVFNVVNGNFSNTLTYADIRNWGINLATLTYDTAHPELFVATITLSYIDESNLPVWALKNVLPSISVDSPLKYKGIIESSEGETDIEALERQISNPKQGWVYTVTPSKQEYFWNGGEWEYMGQLIDVPKYTAGDAIDINSSNEISVIYDGNSIWTGDDGLQVSPSLYVSESDNISVEEKDEDGRVISVLGYKWDPDQKSFAEGKFSNSTDTPAQGSYSHTEGRETKTQGQASHAEGYNTVAYGKASHVEGFGILFNTGSSGFSWEEIENSYGNLKITITTQGGASQKTILTLIRELYFIDDKGFDEQEIYSRETKLKSGFSIERLEINEREFDPTDPYSDPDDPITDGEIFLNCYDTSILVDEGTLDIIVPVCSINLSSHAEGKNTFALGKNAHVEGLVNKVEGENSHAEGHLTFVNRDGYNAHAEGYNTRALKNQAHSEGANTQAYGENSHVEGEETCAWGKDSHAEGKSSNSPALYNDGYFNDNSKDNIYNAWKLSHGYGEDGYACAWALASHIEGKDNLAVGNNSHAEGQDTCAYGDKSHAEGSNALAQGNNSHAEGDYTKAVGMSSHAEGYHTSANGDLSHTEGWVTIANNPYEHAEGSYNVSHKASTTYGNAGNTQHSVGIGRSSLTSKNAFEIMQNGDMYVYGVGSYDGVHVKSETGYENTKTLQDVLGTVPSALVQTDWNLTDSTAVDYIKNKPETTLLGPACMYPNNSNPYYTEWDRSWIIVGTNVSYGRGCFIYPKKRFTDMIICEGAANDGTSEADERLRVLVFPSDKYASGDRIKITLGTDYTNHNVGIVLREDTQTDHFHFLNELISDKYIEITLSSHTFDITIGEVEGTPIILNVRSVDTFSSARTYFIWNGSGWTAGPSMTVVPEIKEFIHPTQV